MQDGISKDGSPITSPELPQAKYWNSPAAAHWVALQERLDALFAGPSAVAIDHARPMPGEHVLDLGCGCGATVIELARRVGPSGPVTGVDVSAPMLGRARERVAAAGLGQVELTLADAGTHAFAARTVDLIFFPAGQHVLRRSRCRLRQSARCAEARGADGPALPTHAGGEPEWSKNRNE